MPKVFIGVGHGGSDPGAVANGLRESDLNLTIALACVEILEHHGVTVVMSRKTDVDDPISKVIRECNTFKPDLAVDIHNNAGGGHGSEVFYSKVGGTGKTLAENIEKQYKSSGRTTRGTKTKLNKFGYDYYGFIRETIAPAIIVECAFIDSSDYVFVKDITAQRRFGEYIAKGILDTLGIPFIDKSNINQIPGSSQSSTNGVKYRVIAGSYKSKENANKTVDGLNKIGYEAFIIEYKK